MGEGEGGGAEMGRGCRGREVQEASGRLVEGGCFQSLKGGLNCIVTSAACCMAQYGMVWPKKGNIFASVHVSERCLGVWTMVMVMVMVCGPSLPPPHPPAHRTRRPPVRQLHAGIWPHRRHDMQQVSERGN